jgi:hypothetical protein
VVSPDWPNEQVLLSSGDVYRGQLGADWWHVYHADVHAVRVAGFSSSGRTLAIASSGELTLYTRRVRRA